MTEKTEALRLAAELDAEIQRTVQVDMMHHNAATELRRLSIENDALGLHLSERMKDLAVIEAQRDALLEALRWTARALDHDHPAAVKARAAIAKVEGEQA